MKEDEQHIQNKNIHNEFFAKYRMYITIILTIFTIISILPLSKKSMDDFRILVSILMVLGFVIITTCMKKYYPYSVIPNVFLIGIVSNIKPGTGMYIALIPFVYFAALWYHEKLGFIYPFSLSLVSGIVLTIEENVDFLMGMFFLTIQAIVLSVVILLITRMSREADKYFNSFGTGILSLIIFLITFIVFNRYGL